MRRRHGFTLIELIIALGLATVLILIATQAFSVITQTIAKVNKLNTENGLLRSGFWTVMQNADYWNSDVDTEAPYLRVHNRRVRSDSSDAVKRPFSPVVFAAETNEELFLGDTATKRGGAAYRPMQNPNVFLPHDPRRWYRNGLWGSAQPAYMIPEEKGHGIPIKRSSWRNGNWPDNTTPRMWFGDYGLHQATDMADEGVDGRFRVLDWDGSSIDGPLVIDVDGDGTPDAPDNDREADEAVFNQQLDGDLALTHRRTCESRPRAFWQLHQRLGHFGNGLYFHHMPFLIVDQHGNMPRADSRPSLSGPLAAGDQDQVDDFQSHNSYVSGRDGSKGGMYSGDSDILSVYGEGANDWSGALEMGGTDGLMAFVYQPHRGPDFFETMHKFSEDLPPYEKMSKDGYFLYAPFRARSSTATVIGENTSFSAEERKVVASRHPRFTSTTMLFPFGITDQVPESLVEENTRTKKNLDIGWSVDRLEDEMVTKYGGNALAMRELLRSPDFSERPSGYPTMRMDFLRYHRLNGAQLTVGQVVVTDTETGNEIRLMITPTCTTYRGARQYWAERHIRQGGTYNSPDAQGNPPAGDFYVYQ